MAATLCRLWPVVLAMGASGGCLDGAGSSAAVVSEGDRAARGASGASEADALDAPLVIDLWIGGPNPARYHVETSDGSCSRLTSGRGSLEVRYAKNRSSPSRVRLAIPDAAAADSGTEAFRFDVQLEGDRTDVTYAIDGTSTAGVPRGVGRATVLDRGSDATVVVEGVTTDAVRLGAIIRCRKVKRLEAMDGG